MSAQYPIGRGSSPVVNSRCTWTVAWNLWCSLVSAIALGVLCSERTRDPLVLDALEGYGHGMARGYALTQLGELDGVIRTALFEAGVPFVEVAPATLKKYATGRGNATKPRVPAKL